MATPTGLQKVPIEIPFKGGLTEKIHEGVGPPEGFYRLENVELDKIGAFTRRRGYEIMTDAIINSVSTAGVPRKLGPREDEIFRITEDLGALGSGGGAGASGATLFTYSPEADAWRDNGKVPSVTLERFAGLTSGQPTVKTLDVGYCSHQGKEFLVMAYTVGEFVSANTGIYVVVYDVSSRSMIQEPFRIDDGTPSFAGKVQIVSIGQYAVILFRDGIASAADFIGRVYDASNNDLSNPITIYAASTRGGNDIWCATTDGTSLFLATYNGTEVRLEKFSVTGTTLPSSAQVSVTETISGGIWCSLAGTTVHVTWSVTGVGVRYWATTLTPAAVASPITVSATTDAPSKTYTAPVSASEAVVFWDKAGNATDDFSVLWRWVKTASTAPAVRANTHRVPGIQVGASPFVFNNRVFLPTIGCMNGNPEWESEAPVNTELGAVLTNFGFCLCEVNSVSAAEESATGNPYLTMLPVATWSRDVSRYSKPALSAFGGTSDRYIASVRQSRQADSFFIERRGQKTPVAHTVSVWSLDIIRIRFDDPKRWQHAEAGGATALACALPYVYDGMNTHECGYVFRPSLVDITETGAGSWNSPQVVLYKVVYEWEDVRGGRWFSDSSYTARHEVAGTATALRLRFRPLAISAKVLGGSGLTGRIRINVYRADEEAPEEFKLLNTVSFMIFDGSGNPIVSFGIFDDDNSDTLLANERSYLTGGELDNSCAPPCRSLVQHRDRLFCIDTENNKLWYTKPFNRDRGIEWSRFQTLALPSRGMALASIEGSLIVLCESQIMVLEGQGPASTGLPPDGYSRLMVLTQDQGCSEVNAVWRLPSGCLFKTTQGLWGIGGSLGITYVGHPVEDILRTVIRFVEGALDEPDGCLRLLVLRVVQVPVPNVPEGIFQNEVGYWHINYWYDSNRWSVDKFSGAATGTHYTSLAHRGQYYQGTTEGVLRRSNTRKLDGIETAGNTYLASIRSGWYRLESLSSFKRLWRVMVDLVMARNVFQDAALETVGLNPLLDVQVTVETQGAVDGEVSRTVGVFSANELEGLEPKSVRLHVKFQKGQAYRITIEEIPNVETLTSDDGDGEGPLGYTFLGIGLELGLKRGAAKLPAGRSL